MNTWKKIAFSSLFVALVVQLSACGFHLRGTGDVGAIAFSSVELEVQPGVNQDVYRSLKRQIQAQKMTLLDSAADIRIKLEATGYKTSTTSRSGLGEVASQLIKMTQGFTAVDLKTKKVMTSGTVTVMRDRQVNTSEIVASDTELRSIKKMMTEDLARQVLQRVIRASQSKLNPSTPSN